MAQPDEMRLARRDERDAGICFVAAAVFLVAGSFAVFAVIFGAIGSAFAVIAALAAFAGRTKRAIALSFVPTLESLATVPINLAQIGGSGAQLLRAVVLGSLVPFTLLVFGLVRLYRAQRRRHVVWAVNRRVAAGPPTPFAHRPAPVEPRVESHVESHGSADV